jgi:hypothetical protein
VLAFADRWHVVLRVDETSSRSYAYDGIDETCEFDAQGNVDAIYVYKDGFLLAKIQPGVQVQ